MPRPDMFRAKKIVVVHETLNSLNTTLPEEAIEDFPVVLMEVLLMKAEINYFLETDNLKSYKFGKIIPIHYCQLPCNLEGIERKKYKRKFFRNEFVNSLDWQIKKYIYSELGGL